MVKFYKNNTQSFTKIIPKHKYTDIYSSTFLVNTSKVVQYHNRINFWIILSLGYPKISSWHFDFLFGKKHDRCGPWNLVLAHDTRIVSPQADLTFLFTGDAQPHTARRTQNHYYGDSHRLEAFTTSLGCFSFPQARKQLLNWLSQHSMTAVGNLLRISALSDHQCITWKCHNSSLNRRSLIQLLECPPI